MELLQPMRPALLVFSLCLTACELPVAPAEWSPSTDPHELAARYAAFAETLDAGAIEKRYPAEVAKLRAQDSKTKLEGVRSLAATGEVEALPWFTPLLESDDVSVRMGTGSYLSGFIERDALLRRDSRIPEAVVLLPPGEGEVDLRPLAWNVLLMLRQPDNGNTHAYAASMIRYLRLHEFVPLLEPCLDSRHPAVRRSAETTIAYLDLQRAFEANPERDDPDVQRALARIGELLAKHEEESAALSRAAAAPVRDPMSDRFLRAYPDGDAISFDPPEPIDWESLAPAEYKSFDIDEPPAALLERLTARIDMFGNVEIPFLEVVPSSFQNDQFYLIAETGIQPLKIQNLRGFVRFGFDVNPGPISGRIFFGEILAKLADDAPPTGGFVLRLEEPMPRERGAVAKELTSPQWGQKPVRSSYSFRIAEGGELFSFVRWQPEEVECEYQLSIFRDEQELRWTGYGCDV